MRWDYERVIGRTNGVISIIRQANVPRGSDKASSRAVDWIKCGARGELGLRQEQRKRLVIDAQS